MPHLFRLWSRTRKADSKPEDARDAAADELTIHGLGLELHETWSFLYLRPSTFSEFESWILERNGSRESFTSPTRLQIRAHSAASRDSISGWNPGYRASRRIRERRRFSRIPFPSKEKQGISSSGTLPFLMARARTAGRGRGSCSTLPCTRRAWRMVAPGFRHERPC